VAKIDFATGDKLTAEQMNALGTEVNGKAEKSDIPTVPSAPTADTLSGATATGKAVLKAADAAAARSAIGAGTSSLKVGTAATDAKAGDYVPAWAEVTGKPTIPSIAGLAKQADLDALVARVEALETTAGE
jgi:hypothetical protein